MGQSVSLTRSHCKPMAAPSSPNPDAPGVWKLCLPSLVSLNRRQFQFWTMFSSRSMFV